MFKAVLVSSHPRCSALLYSWGPSPGLFSFSCHKASILMKQLSLSCYIPRPGLHLSRLCVRGRWWFCVYRFDNKTHSLAIRCSWNNSRTVRAGKTTLGWERLRLTSSVAKFDCGYEIKTWNDHLVTGCSIFNYWHDDVWQAMARRWGSFNKIKIPMKVNVSNFKC